MNNFAALNLQVSIGAETLFKIGGFSVTNALLCGIVGSLIAIFVLVYTAVSIKRGRYNRFIGLVQWVFEGLLKQVNDIIPDKKLAKKMTPLAITVFFVVMFNYWLSVLPGLDSIRIGGVPILRSLTADLNFTLALAIITVVTVQIYAVKYLGVFGNIGRYVRNPLKNPMGAFEGALEVIGEFSRGLALALRLFGNAFAGEILLVVIGLLASYAASVVLPFFMIFELFIGFIQAYVFFVLVLIFTSLAVTHQSEHGEKSAQEA